MRRATTRGWRSYGAEIVLDGAVLLGQRGAGWRQTASYHYRNVIGPDEYHDRIDDNCYTNYMARWHLQTALRGAGLAAPRGIRAQAERLTQ